MILKFSCGLIYLLVEEKHFFLRLDYICALSGVRKYKIGARDKDPIHITNIHFIFAFLTLETNQGWMQTGQTNVYEQF